MKNTCAKGQTRARRETLLVVPDMPRRVLTVA